MQLYSPVVIFMQDTMMMGADYYQTEAEIAARLAEGKVPVGIGRDTKIKWVSSSEVVQHFSKSLFFFLFNFVGFTHIVICVPPSCRNCIIDKNAKIGKNVIIANKDVSVTIISRVVVQKETIVNDDIIQLQGVEEAERPSEGFYIRSGITVVLKNTTIKDGTLI